MRSKVSSSKKIKERVFIEIFGVVQGVGFRPFVYRLAQSLSLKGKVFNSSQGVFIDAEGAKDRIDQFLVKLKTQKPRIAYIQSFQYVYLALAGYKDFQIVQSQKNKSQEVLISPDIATCPQCLKEIFDPKDRRYLYPFANCTFCGPRYTIIEAIPYDRCRTSMKTFSMCEECSQEYQDPANRRFHAQPNACPVCGPQVFFLNSKGRSLCERQEAIVQAVKALNAGKILAVKGLGGFHLMVDATSEEAVQRLRRRKNREAKPFAVMFLKEARIKRACKVSLKEEMLLASPEAPIVLLEKKKKSSFPICSQVAPGNPFLGAMLPYTPLHHILLKTINRPLVATSGNLSDEPICIDEQEALKKLSGVADFFLMHNRPIVRHADDSIVRIIHDRPMVIRRARGYAPLGVSVNQPLPSVVSYGAHLKNTIGLGVKKYVFLSQHIGDLETKESLETFKKTRDSLENLYQCKNPLVSCDLHPDYLSTKEAQKQKKRFIQVQHHHAHIAACMAENQLNQEVLGFAWDGTGLGTDRTIWGGEALLASYKDFQRVATFKRFPLPGGDLAVREPRRTALAILYSLYGKKVEEFSFLETVKSFKKSERQILYQMIDKKINTPLTSSVGRLFDAISSLLSLTQVNDYEGQAAMMLEYLTAGRKLKSFYPFSIEKAKEGKFLEIFWEKMIQCILQDIQNGQSCSAISKKAHNTFVEIALAIARQIKKQQIVLSGGCFQNRYLTENIIDRLTSEGFCVYTHQRVPPNDGCIALGQIMIAAAQ